jgi:Flp pilus assembly protein TadG
MTPKVNNTRDERGVAMLYAAVFLLSSVWLVSLALDMGKLMATKTELQRAADAAALAGASAVDSNTGKLLEDLARERAATTSAANDALREKAEPVVIDPEADVAFPKPNRVQVWVHRTEATGNPMTTIFARTLGINSLDVRATATAEVSPINSCEGTPPFGLVNAPGGYTPGQEYTFNLDPVSTPLQSLGTGQPASGNVIDSYIIDFSVGGQACNQGPCAGLGGNSLGCYILNGYGCCLLPGDEFQTMSLNAHFTTVKNSLQDRWDGDTDRRKGITYAEYAGNGNRVLICPIVEVVGGGGSGTGNSADLGGNGGNGDIRLGAQHDGGGNGNSDGNDGGGGAPVPVRVKVVGFTAFFLTDDPKTNQLIVGTVINYVAPGDPTNTPTQNKLYGTRLVLDE